MLVADSITRLQYMKKLFEELPELKDRVDFVDNGRAAVNLVQKSYKDGTHLYKLILIDYRLPHMDGPTATRKIRQLENLHK